jgi:hypothetical protein
MKFTGRTDTSLSLSVQETVVGQWSNPGKDDLVLRALGKLAELSQKVLLIVIVVAHPIWVVCSFELVFGG